MATSGNGDGGSSAFRGHVNKEKARKGRTRKMFFLIERIRIRAVVIIGPCIVNVAFFFVIKLNLESFFHSNSNNNNRF
jgi:hypothetical protein